MNINISTGNSIVDAVGRMNFSGNVIPEAWYKTVTKNGKPNLLAINILAEIVYWYRPTEFRDESNNAVSFKKKFYWDDYLQKGYRQLCDKFNISTKQAREALKLLESLGVVARHTRDINTDAGTIYNVLFLELFPDVLHTLTFPESEEEVESPPLPKKEPPVSHKETPSPMCTQVILQTEQAIDVKDITNTKSTTNITTDNTTTTGVVKEIINLFNKEEILLPEKDILYIAQAANYDIERCINAVICAKENRTPIRNLTAWLINAVTKNYTVTKMSPRQTKERKPLDYTGRNYSSEFLAMLENEASPT